MEFKESRTYENVLNAYKGELAGVFLYQELSKRANEEGYPETIALFKLLSRQEGTHGRIFKRFLANTGLDYSMSDEEKENLKKMITDVKSGLFMFSQGEIKAGEEVYPSYSKIAKEEGYMEISDMFRKLAKVELSHGARLQNELSKIS